MGCTHSRNSKSKAAKTEHPLERKNRVEHFDETSQSADGTSNESSESTVQPPFSKTLLNEPKKPSVVKEVVKPPVIVVEEFKPAQESSPETMPQTAIPAAPTQKQFVSSTYYPMPTVGEKQNSPEKKKSRKKAPEPVVEEKKKIEPLPREKSTAIGPNYRPRLTADDLECIRRAVQQRNERRAYMMTHRNDTDDTLYELEVRMPEKDYTARAVY